MGIYLNPGNALFSEALSSKIYVDKTGLIRYTNESLGTAQKNICISRPRRFGKSMAANMLCAYYDRTCDSRELFAGLKIAKDPSFEQHLNQYDVLFLNMQDFLYETDNIHDLLSLLQSELMQELAENYSEQVQHANGKLITALGRIYNRTHRGFVFIIDEWDCIFRQNQKNFDAQKKYLDFLRTLLKDKSYVKLAYMTGILPIKKYGEHSALNMFDEYSMTDPADLAEYVGFTETEVQQLCQQYGISFEETQNWYDGYRFDDLHIYSPKSVVDCVRRKKFGSYWTSTETYEALRIYIDMNYNGLKDSIVQMIGGGHCKIDTGSFQNDMTTFQSQDDVLTLLVHLGYLAYDVDRQGVFIPNEEVRAEFIRAVKHSNWKEVIDAVSASEDLLEATLHGDESAVAKGIDSVHMDTTSILQYNNENSLSCVISLAYYSARNYYSIIRELPTGKGFADLVFLPRKKYSDYPAMVIELKWDQSANTAITQIKKKQYVKALEEYTGNILLVGITYNKDTKKHECSIEAEKKWAHCKMNVQ